MRRWNRWILCSVLLTPAFSCVDAPDTDEAPQAPAEVLRQRVDPERTLLLTEEIRLGGEESAAFRDVTAVELDEAGSMYVLERGNNWISVFDEQGNPLRRIGQEGQGRGEFVGLTSFSVRRDTILVGDARNRVHVFLTDGTHVLTRVHTALGRVGDGWRTGDGVTGTPEGWLVPGQAYFREGVNAETGEPPAPLQRMRLHRMDEAGTLTESGFVWAHESPGEWDGYFWLQPPYVLHPSWGIDGLGRVLVADTYDYLIDIYGADGSLLLQVYNEVERRPITPGVVAEYESTLCESGPECFPDRNQRQMAMTLPEYLQEVGAVKGFPSGHFAVQRAYVDDHPTHRTAGGDWDLFAPDGSFLGRLPIDCAPQWFDGEQLVATVSGELDVQHVVRFRVGEETH